MPPMKRACRLARPAPCGAGLAALILLGCSGASAPDAGTTLTGPSGMRVSFEKAPQSRDSSTVLILDWVPSSSPVDGYALALSVGGGAFQNVPGDPITASSRRYFVTFDQKLPELLGLTFRLTAVSRGNAGGSTLASITVPLNSPDSFDIRGTADGIELLIDATSRFATQLRLDRNDGISRELPINTRRFVDVQVNEGTPYMYTVKLTDGTYSSIPFTSESASVALFRPIHFTFRSTRPDQIMLSWNSRSVAVRGARLRRWMGAFDSPAGEVTELGPEQILVVPPNTAHGFRNTGETPLLLFSVHESGTLEQTFLGAEPA